MLAIFGCRVTMVDFVRNCLDPEIKEALTTQAHVLRFVKADLTQPLPAEAVSEYGFCCDVMEHIPPDKVDTVLDHILLAAQHTFFAISTVDDVMGPSLIGEHVHLSVHPYTWWLQKFVDRQCVIHWSQEVPGAALFYVTAWATGRDIMKAGVLNETEQKIRENVRINAAAGHPQVTSYPTNDLEVMILGGGPSLDAYEDQIKVLRRQGVKLVTLNGAYTWALLHDLVPSAQIVADARPFNARFTQPPLLGTLPDGTPECRYLLASQCHPDTFLGLPKDRVHMWHSTTWLIRDVLLEAYGTPHWRIQEEGRTDEHGNPIWLREIEEEVGGLPAIFATEVEARTMVEKLGKGVPVAFARPNPEPWVTVPGGSTVLLRAIPLLRMLGYAKFHLFGCDSCYDGNRHHAYPQKENDGVKRATVFCAGETFRCAAWMVSQAQEFIDLITVMGDTFELEVYGDGLLAHILKAGAALPGNCPPALDVVER
jgi:hypothetical protein